MTAAVCRCGCEFDNHEDNGARCTSHESCLGFVPVAAPDDEGCAECLAAHPASDCAGVDCWHNCPIPAREAAQAEAEAAWLVYREETGVIWDNEYGINEGLHQAFIAGYLAGRDA